MELTHAEKKALCDFYFAQGLDQEVDTRYARDYNDVATWMLPAQHERNNFSKADDTKNIHLLHTEQFVWALASAKYQAVLNKIRHQAA